MERLRDRRKQNPPEVDGNNDKEKHPRPRPVLDGLRGFFGKIGNAIGNWFGFFAVLPTFFKVFGVLILLLIAAGIWRLLFK